MAEERITKTLTEEEITIIINQVKATQEIEGLYTPKEEEEVYRKYLRGELTDKQALDILLRKQG